MPARERTATAPLALTLQELPAAWLSPLQCLTLRYAGAMGAPQMIDALQVRRGLQFSP